MPEFSIEAVYPDLWLEGSPPGHLYSFDLQMTQERLVEMLADFRRGWVKRGGDPEQEARSVVLNTPELIADYKGQPDNLAYVDLAILIYCLQLETCPVGQDRGPAPLVEWTPLYDFEIQIEVRGDVIRVNFKSKMRDVGTTYEAAAGNHPDLWFDVPEALPDMPDE